MPWPNAPARSLGLISTARPAAQVSGSTRGGAHMRRMGGLDAAFLYGETPSWHMHVSAVLLIDPSTTPAVPGAQMGTWSFERFKSHVESRLPFAPQFRWRPVEVPFGLGR